MAGPSGKRRDRRRRRRRTHLGVAPRGGSASRVPSPQEIGTRLLHSEDPLEVELIGSMLVAGLSTTAPVDEALIEDFVSLLSRQRSPESLAVLLAVTAVAEPPLDELARSAAADLKPGFVLPPWADILGREEVREAWRATDAFRDQDAILLAFGYPARDPALATVVVDRTLGRLIKDASVLPEVGPVVERWREQDDVTVESIPVGEAAGEILRALRNTDVTVDPPITEEYALNRAFLAALVRRVPDVEPPPEPEPPPAGVLDRLVDEFLASDEATGLPPVADQAVHTLITYQGEWRADDPLRWSPTVVEMCLLDWLPRSTVLEDEVLRAIPDTLRALVRFAGTRRSLPGDLVSETLDAIDRFEPEFTRALKSPSAGGPSKSLLLAMQKDGVDILDQEQVSAWIKKFNQRPLEERDRTLRGEH
ncbi:MAG: hypothetical protein ACRDKA_08335 [Actinomycetota bacterium]